MAGISTVPSRSATRAGEKPSRGRGPEPSRTAPSSPACPYTQARVVPWSRAISAASTSGSTRGCRQAAQPQGESICEPVGKSVERIVAVPVPVLEQSPGAGQRISICGTHEPDPRPALALMRSRGKRASWSGMVSGVGVRDTIRWPPLRRRRSPWRVSKRVGILLSHAVYRQVLL